MQALTEMLSQEIRDNGGAIPFERFMELAVYAPGLGYYETAARTPGRRGDFYTSVSVGCLFGELLAYQFSRWLDSLGERGKPATSCQIVEAGSHDGRLAEDILNWLHVFRPDLAQRLTYVILEPSAVRQSWQRERLARFAAHEPPHPILLPQGGEGARRAVEGDSAIRNPQSAISQVRLLNSTATKVGESCGQAAQGATVQWHSTWQTVSAVNGIIFSNELLDAFPLRRLGWDRANQRWFEWGVTWAKDRFGWVRLPCSADGSAEEPMHFFNLGQPWSRLGALPEELLGTLPDGYTIEISPRAVAWWQKAAHMFEQGWLLAFDYGYLAGELFRPERTQGTLRAYAHHAQSADVLANPGEQDLTAHVNFSALQHAGREAGTNDGNLVSQSQFFMQTLAAITRNPAGFAPWNAARTRQFQTLTHPDFLGQSFKVLCQEKSEATIEEC
ncbi:MAG: SAM-dependent methyltransferase [Verrucomicrobiota bacterium]